MPAKYAEIGQIDEAFRLINEYKESYQKPWDIIPDAGYLALYLTLEDGDNTEKHLNPELLFVPTDLNQSDPLYNILGIEAKVSTLLIIVGEPNKPFTAGYGGLYLGNPFLPSIDSNIAVSSPAI